MFSSHTFTIDDIWGNLHYLTYVELKIMSCAVTDNPEEPFCPRLMLNDKLLNGAGNDRLILPDTDGPPLSVNQNPPPVGN